MQTTYSFPNSFEDYTRSDAPPIRLNDPSENKHLTTKKDLIALLNKIHEFPELKEKLLNDLDQKDPLYFTAVELLKEDLTSSTLIITDDQKGREWIEAKNTRWSNIVSTAKKVYRAGVIIYSVASIAVGPAATLIGIAQSPWAKILVLLAQKAIFR